MNLRRREFLLAIGAAAGVSLGKTLPVRERPNVLFIYADDLGKGMLSHFGQKHFSTPNIDRIFKEGVTADAADIPLPPGACTLPELFREAGYVTAQIGKLGHGFQTTRRQMARQGWEMYYGYLDHQACHGFYPPFLWSKPEGGEPFRDVLEGNTHKDGAKSEENETYAKRLRRWTMTGKAVYAPDRLIAAAEAFLDRRGQDGRPFFLHYATALPHGPVQIPPSSRRYEGFGATEETFWPAIDPEVSARNRRLCYWDDATGRPLEPPPSPTAEGLTDLEMEYATMVPSRYYVYSREQVFLIVPP